jgi:hypothetical protein
MHETRLNATQLKDSWTHWSIFSYLSLKLAALIKCTLSLITSRILSCPWASRCHEWRRKTIHSRFVRTRLPGHGLISDVIIERIAFNILSIITSLINSWPREPRSHESRANNLSSSFMTTWGSNIHIFQVISSTFILWNTWICCEDVCVVYSVVFQLSYL